MINENYSWMKTLFEPIHRGSWEQARERLNLPLHERIGVMPPCRCNEPVVDSKIKVEEAIASAESFADLCPLVRNATVGLSLFGYRYLTIEGYEGAAPIDAFAIRAMELLRKNPDFNQAERSHGKRISPLINDLYKISDLQVKNSTVRKIFVFIREFFYDWANNCFTPITCSHPRWYWVECETMKYNEIVAKVNYKNRGRNKYFNKYTKNQHESVFYYKYEHIKRFETEEFVSALRSKNLNKEEILQQAHGSPIKRFDAITSAAAQGFEETLKILLTEEAPCYLPYKSHRTFDISLIHYPNWISALGQALILSTYHKKLGCIDLLLKYRSINPEAVVRAISMAEFNNDNDTLAKLREYLDKSEPKDKFQLDWLPVYSQPFRNEVYRR